MEFVESGAIVQQTINEIPKNLQSTVFRWSHGRCLATAAADRRRWVHGNGSTLKISHGFLAGKASLESFRRFVEINSDICWITHNNSAGTMFVRRLVSTYILASSAVLLQIW